MIFSEKSFSIKALSCFIFSLIAFTSTDKIQAIARCGEAGLARTTLFEQLNDDVLVAPRVRDLLREGLAVEREGRLHLSERGRKLVGLFFDWRRLQAAAAGGYPRQSRSGRS